jgi:hypothetical protein
MVLGRLRAVQLVNQVPPMVVLISQHGLRFITTISISFIFQMRIFNSFAFLVVVLTVSAGVDDLIVKDPANGVRGVTANGLTPIFQFVRYSDNWTIQIDFQASSSLPAQTWLRITNRVDSKVALWSTNGVAIPLKDSTAIAVNDLPTQSEAANVLRGVSRSRRGGQWWPSAAVAVKADDIYPMATFSLGNTFGFSLTNDVILSLAPLMYGTKPGSQLLTLVEWPTNHYRLNANGTVQEIR